MTSHHQKPSVGYNYQETRRNIVRLLSEDHNEQARIDLEIEAQILYFRIIFTIAAIPSNPSP